MWAYTWFAQMYNGNLIKKGATFINDLQIFSGVLMKLSCELELASRLDDKAADNPLKYTSLTE